MARVRRLLTIGCALLLARTASAAEPSDELAARIEAAPAGSRLVLPEGRFRANLVVRKPLTLVGAGVGRTVLLGTVTFASGGGAEKLGIESAGEGHTLVLRGETRLSDVTVRGSDSSVVRLSEGGRLVAEDLAITCRERSAAGLSVAGAVEATRLSVDGSCRRGLDVTAGGSVVLRSLRVTGALDAGVRVVEGSLDWDGGTVQLEADAGSAALFAARSTLRLRDVHFSGGEQGALVRKGEATFAKVSVEGARTAGLALVQASVTVDGATLSGPFGHAAVLATEAPRVSLNEVDVVHAGAAGLLSVHSAVVVRGMRVAGLRVDEEGDFGHGFVFERSTGEVSRASVEDAQGGVVWASGPSKVTLDDVKGQRVRLGIAAMGGAEVSGKGFVLAGNPKVGAIAWGRSRISLDRAPDAGAALAACTGSTLAVPESAKARVRSCSDDDLARGWADGADR